SQVMDYAAQLPLLQAQGIVPEGEIRSYLVAPHIPSGIAQLCHKQGIYPVAYDPRRVLSHFFSKFRHRMTILGITPHNHGVWHLGVIHPVLDELMQSGAADANTLSEQTKLSKSTIRSYLTLSEQLGVVQRSEKNYQLTAIGQLYQQSVAESKRAVSEEQAALLRGHILKQPFASGVTVGIFTVVENVMTLARNSYPVPLEVLSQYFTLSVGNQNRWQHTKTRLEATRMYVEYAAQLGLLARVGDNVYLTPEGVRFTLLLQLHKAIHLLDALQIPAP
ncbi:MAG: hypothetical protein NZL85_11585, partial [Fimbriimonadales bacterium]|nr:hypothetical protein [Fimbriimonadales bacterium]